MAIHSGIKSVSAPTYLYRQRGIYYYRYALPQPLRVKYSKVEVRLSLRTAYRRIAQPHAHTLHVVLLLMLEDNQMLSYEEIKYRLNKILLHRINNKLLAPKPAKAQYSPDAVEQLFENVQLEIIDGKIQYKYAGDIAIFQTNLKQFASMLEKKTQHFSEVTKKICGYLIKNDVFSETEISELSEQHIEFIVKNYILQYDLIKQVLGELAHTPPIETTKNALENQINNFEQNHYLKKTDHKLSEFSSFCPASNEPLEAITLQNAIEKMVSWHLEDGTWKAHMEKDHRSRLQYLLDFFGGHHEINKISEANLREFRHVLSKLPPNRKKIAMYKDKNMREVAAMNSEKTLSEKTIKNIMIAASALFEWAYNLGYVLRNPTKNIKTITQSNPRDAQPPFKQEELMAVFNHPKFAQDKFKQPAYYWIPLIGLFTGMRLEEICQLHCTDIYEQDGIWVIDCNSKDGKKLKTPNAARLIPVHETLKDLGILDYLGSVQKTRSTRLFPQLTTTQKTDKLGKQPGKQFKAVLKDLGLDDALSFNSLRHTFADFFKQNGVSNTDVLDYIFGHKNKRLMVSTYGGDYKANVLYDEIISKLDYGINLSHLKNTKFRFNQPLKKEKKK